MTEETSENSFNSGARLLKNVLLEVVLWELYIWSSFLGIGLDGVLFFFFLMGFLMPKFWCQWRLLSCCSAFLRWTYQLGGPGSRAAGTPSGDRPRERPRLPSAQRHHTGACLSYRRQWQQAVFPTVPRWEGIVRQGMWKVALQHLYYFWSLVLSTILW